MALIPFKNNEPVINLISKKPLGLMIILEDQVRVLSPCRQFTIGIHVGGVGACLESRSCSSCPGVRFKEELPRPL